MKKGFTMIELIFVIVILGILASVAIPRLAGTKADAEISAAVANLRTLVSDAGAYHVVKGDFTNAKWNDITNVPLKNATTNTAGNAVGTAATANLTVGGKDCIGVHLVNKNGDTPAHIKFTTTGTDSVCTQVQNAAPVKAYLDSKAGDQTSAMAIGSSTSIYTAAATAAPVVAAQVAAQVTAPKPVAAKTPNKKTPNKKTPNKKTPNKKTPNKKTKGK